MSKHRNLRLLIESVALGVVGALCAQIFIWTLKVTSHFLQVRIAGYQEPGIPSEGGVLQQVIGPHAMWIMLAVITVAGLVSGALVYHFAPEAEGHGTDTVVKAFHRAGGFIRARVPPLKLVASAITIGSGGAAGREGPTALIVAGLGSTYATWGKRSNEDRRLLLIIGMAAGLSAVFRSPIGAAIFAVEVLYGTMDFEAEALVYTILSSVVAYAIGGFFSGWRPLFVLPSNATRLDMLGYVCFGVLGITSGLIATILPEVFYRIRDFFRSLRVPPSLNPAIGALGVGLIALAYPQVLGGGYGWIQEAINGSLTMRLLFALLFLKIIAFALTVGSGGSGGIFAPTLFVGAMLGGLLAAVFHLPSCTFVVIGMMAVFGGAARVPIASLIMVTEMTGGYQLVPPAALTVIVAFVIQTTLSTHLKYPSLYEAQVPDRAHSPASYQESVEMALKLLDAGQIPSGIAVGHLDLVSLLNSGIPINMAGGKTLSVGVVVGNASPTLANPGAKPGSDSAAVMAIVRGEKLLIPSAGLSLKPADRIFALGSPEANQKLLAQLGAATTA